MVKPIIVENKYFSSLAFLRWKIFFHRSNKSPEILIKVRKLSQDA